MRDFFNSVFAYKTPKEVRFENRCIALFYYFLVLLSILYVSIYSIAIHQSHRISTQGTGTVVKAVYGKLFGKNLNTSQYVSYDQGDLILPFMDESSIFVPTKLYSLTGQVQDYCGEGNTLDYCPRINDPNARPQATTNKLTYYPNPAANAYTIDDLLSLANTSLAETRERGGVFRVVFDWQCDLDFSNCQSNLSVYRLSGGKYTIGGKKNIVNYQESAHSYQNSSGGFQQDSMYMVGITFILDSSGSGSQFNFNKLLIQIGMALTFMMFSRILMDCMISTCARRSTRKVFAQATIKAKADFHDFREGIEDIKKEREYGTSGIAELDESIRDV